MSKPIYKNFRIDVDGYRFLDVLIWRDKELFKAATLSNDDACYFGHTVQVVVEEGHRIGYWPYLGSVNFVRGDIGVGIVAHEMCHAAHHYAKILERDDPEELICETTQRLCAAFWLTVKDRMGNFRK